MSSTPPDTSSSATPDALQDAAVPNRIVARRGDGSEYQGDLLRDIVRYRNLRALNLAGEAFTDEQRSLLQSLELFRQIADALSICWWHPHALFQRTS